MDNVPIAISVIFILLRLPMNPELTIIPAFLNISVLMLASFATISFYRLIYSCLLAIAEATIPIKYTFFIKRSYSVVSLQQTAIALTASIPFVASGLYLKKAL
jgi:hypothetical protein